VWLNDAQGLFLQSDHELGSSYGFAVALGDLDDDGDLDAFVGNYVDSRVWFNKPPEITSLTPEPGSHTAPRDIDIAATYDQEIDPGSATAGTFVVHAMQTGRLLGPANAVNTNGKTVTLRPGSDIRPGELVQATATEGIRNVGGYGPEKPFVWHFRTAVTGGAGTFVHSGQTLSGFGSNHGVAVGDIDHDGDLDAFMANFGPNQVWLNDGTGGFSDSGQTLGDAWSRDVALGDLDGDGDLDAVVATGLPGTLEPNEVWLNDGAGIFSLGAQKLPNSDSRTVSLGDVDGDGDLDAFFGTGYGLPSEVWLNDGLGSFSDSGQSLGNSEASATVLADVDVDGDLDVLVANFQSSQPNRLWLNDGQGNFVDTRQELGSYVSRGIAIGDFDLDGDLDAIFANWESNKVWLNDGHGNFTDSEQDLGSEPAEGVATGDFDGDGDLDVIFANDGANQVWCNDGTGNFFKSAQRLGDSHSDGIALGDLDGDGDLDAFVGNLGASEIWLNKVPAYVTSLEPTPSGFVADFSLPFDPTVLNLYDVESGTRGPADVTLIGEASGRVAGSIVVEDSRLVFIATGGLLADDHYTVRIRSADDAFRHVLDGMLLDGNHDGIPGGDYIDGFSIGGIGTRVVTLPDFARGPAQTVNAPAMQTGLPLTVSDGSGIQSVNLTIVYNETLLNIIAANPGPDAPEGAEVIPDWAEPGRLHLQFSSPTPLNSGAVEFVTFAAKVPDAATGGTAHVLDIRDLIINDGTVAATADDAIHSVAYFGDTTGNGDYSGLDAVQIARVVVGRDLGFAAYALIDPAIIADVTGNGDLSGLDAVLVAQKVVGLAPPEIPELPSNSAPQSAPGIPSVWPASQVGNAGSAGVAALRSESRLATEAPRPVNSPPLLLVDIVLSQFRKQVSTDRNTSRSLTVFASNTAKPRPLPFVRSMEVWQAELRDARAIDKTLSSNVRLDLLEDDSLFSADLVDDLIAREERTKSSRVAARNR
jgi:hypothetical protein